MAKKEENNQKIEIIRHSTAHLMAAAIMQLWPEAKLGVGPVIEHGFYYDFELPRQLTPEDFPIIEKKMKELAKEGLTFEREELPIAKAIKLFKDQGQDYKVELLKDLKERGTTKISEAESQDVGNDVSTVSIYKTGSFIDLCRGPHVKSTKELKIFKLDKLASAYWRGNEKNPQLQRIYGLAFKTKDGLAKHLEWLKEARKRNHRRLGKELDLFVLSPYIGSGLPLYTIKGNIVRQAIISYCRELQSAHYGEVATQPLSRAELFKISGHYDKFKDDMFHVRSNYSEEEFFLKPMNCPQHIQIYTSQLRSYKDLPIRYSDFTHLHRDEKPGELSGLTRLRGFCQDDGHSFCREDQVVEEFELVLQMIEKAMSTYGMEYKIQLSLWDPEQKEKYLGSEELWEKAQTLLEDLLKKNKIDYDRVEGEAAFYGPKMDLIAQDSLHRQWQLSTIQLDLNMPERFGATYVDKNGNQKTPIMIHRAIVGSPERFMGVLIEHYAGAFPTWLSPVQIQFIPVGDDFVDEAQKIAEPFTKAGVRVEIDKANETVGNKIRKAEKLRVPYMIVIGAKEKAAGKLQIRARGRKETIEYSTADFLKQITKEIKDRK